VTTAGQREVSDSRKEIKSLPLVQVGIPVFNGEKDIARTIEALLSQDYPNLEVLVSDNCSTDKTGEIARQYAATNNRVKYWCNEKNIGSFANFELLFSKSEGEYYFWAGHNDTYSPGFLTKAISIMESDPSVVHCFPHGFLANRDGTIFPYPFSFIDTRNLSKPARFLATIWHLGPCTEFYGVYRRSVLQKVMPFKKLLPIDYILLAEISALGASAYVADEQMKLPVNRGSILKTARRHGFNPDANFGEEQYGAVCRELIGIARKHLSFLSFVFVLPSMYLCLKEKFIFIKHQFDSAHKAEAEGNYAGQ
jgi:glycosyltransferase involved in cell wall biosynthesis